MALYLHLSNRFRVVGHESTTIANDPFSQLGRVWTLSHQASPYESHPNMIVIPYWLSLPSDTTLYLKQRETHCRVMACCLVSNTVFHT